MFFYTKPKSSSFFARTGAIINVPFLVKNLQYVRTLRVYVFFPMCGASVCMGTLRFCVFPLCVGPVLETLKIF